MALRRAYDRPNSEAAYIFSGFANKLARIAARSRPCRTFEAGKIAAPLAITGLPAEVCERMREMEDRSSRRLRTLVTNGPLRPVGNEIAGALISMMAGAQRAPTRGRIH